MIKIITVFALSIALLTGCDKKQDTEDQKDQISLQELIKQEKSFVSRMVEQRLSLELFIDKHRAVEGFQSINVTYSGEFLAEISTARIYMLQLLSIYMTHLNDNKDLRVYLKSYPVDEKFVRLRILFLNADKSLFGDRLISSVSLYNGMISYQVNDDTGDVARYETIHKETVLEALENLKEDFPNYQIPIEIETEVSQWNT